MGMGMVYRDITNESSVAVLPEVYKDEEILLSRTTGYTSSLASLNRPQFYRSYFHLTNTCQYQNAVL